MTLGVVLHRMSISFRAACREDHEFIYPQDAEVLHRRMGAAGTACDISAA